MRKQYRGLPFAKSGGAFNSAFRGFTEEKNSMILFEVAPAITSKTLASSGSNDAGLPAFGVQVF